MRKKYQCQNTYNIQFIPGCGYGCQSMTCRGKSPFFSVWTHISLMFCMGLRHPSVLITQYQWERFFSLVLDISCKSSSFYTNSIKVTEYIVNISISLFHKICELSNDTWQIVKYLYGTVEDSCPSQHKHWTQSWNWK